ncbi:metallophosphoesterase family protein [Alkaliphilus serpentinus]|uniref:DNA repair exonuclease n=1 Tax=Alkaliphilus serpentinus TaxID=1482731 RepID=A0A833M7S9_9FIRM|nr:DNA repair exonuclease [Alkaliphilus serpentinus]KAB3529202.1 DNA repair exonuclease [Alkaliphilus serpentinus]
MFKFIHIADIHLDTSFYSSNKDLRSKLRNSLREAFLRVIDTCINEGVNALLIAGDFFDDELLTFQTESMIIDGIRQLEGYNIHVYYSTGNHDPGDISYRANLIKWPSNFHLIDNDRLQTFDVMGTDGRAIGRILSVGHQTKVEGRNLISQFPAKEGDLPHVGLVHAMVTSASGIDRHDRYLPCSLEDLKEKGYDYWALGHIHQRQQISNENICYPGNLQGRHPRETGEKGGNLVEIDELGRVKVEFIKFSTIRWETLIVKDLDKITTYEELKDHIMDRINTFLKEGNIHNGEVILRLELAGRCYLEREMNEEESRYQLEADIKQSFGFIAVEAKTGGLLKAINLEEYQEGNHVLGKALSIMNNIESNEKLMENLSQLKLANKKINNAKDRKQYYKELLQGLEEEALNRMVGDGE